MGDHQILLKGPVHYRGLIRIPFIWCDPEVRKQVKSKALTQTTDIAPTILERAGVEPWNGIQGHSLLALIGGKRERLRERLLIEEEGQRYYMGFPDRVRTRSVITDRYRLSLYDGLRPGQSSQCLVPVARQQESLEVFSEVAPLGQRPEQRVELGGVRFEWTRCRWTKTTLGHGETSGLP